MKGLWHFAQGPETKCGQEWQKDGEAILDTVGTLQAWVLKLAHSDRDPRVHMCFRCVYEVAKETKADRRAFLRATIVQGGTK